MDMMNLFKPAVPGKRFSAVLLTALMLWGLLLAPNVHAAQAQSGTSQLVTGAACFIATPVYGAFKLAFAGVGSVIGGLTWVFTGGDYYAAKKVWDASQKGTYIITPEHLSGAKPIEFVGPH